MSDKSYIAANETQTQVTRNANGSLLVNSGGEKSNVHLSLQLERIDYQTQRVFADVKMSRRLYWVFESRGKRVLSWPGGSMEFEALDLTEGSTSSTSKLKPLKLTMPGKVVAVKVKEGEIVETAQPLLVIEAMKMENLLLAPAKAKISKVHVSAGDRLESGATLITFEAVE